MVTAPAPSLFCGVRYCKTCKKQTRFIPIHFAVADAGVSRRTIYYWMKRGLIQLWLASAESWLTSISRAEASTCLIRPLIK